MIYLVRHGEIEKEVDKKIYIGQLDVNLNKEGIKQSQRLSIKLQHIPFQKIYCSSLKRTIKTAEIISKNHGIEPEMVDEFREIDLGEWEGVSFNEIKGRYPNKFEKRGKNIIHYCVPGGESFYQCNQRVIKKFYELLYITKGDILIVAHAGVNRLILCNILGISLEKIFQMPQKYGCFNTIAENCGKLQVKNINQ